MKNTSTYFLPSSVSGSFLASIIVHALIVASVIIAMKADLFGHAAPVAEYTDLGYQTFDEPPPEKPQEEHRVKNTPTPVTPAEKTVKMDNLPHEMQDAKSDVVGNEKAAPQPQNLGSNNNGNAADTPYYQIKPKYPKAALIEGIEGWIQMQIDITETGEVENIRVVGGEQRNMFQSEARRAVSEWKYKPFLDKSGQPMRVANHEVRVDFKLIDGAPTVQ